VLDAFCGSGALGLEALSRGAAHATFMDTSRAALECARANAEILGETPHSTFRMADAGRAPAADEPVTLAFLDPPYGTGLAEAALASLADADWLAASALVTLEIGRDETFEAPARFEILDERATGAARILILRFAG
jgi:16S rRNA (guanine966-N2)-methyltransferase